MSTDDAPSIEEIAAGEASPEEVDAYNEAKREELAERADERLRELSEQQRDALDKLAPERETTVEPIQLGAEAEVHVKTHMTEWVEDELQTIFAEASDPPTYRDRMPAVMEWVIADDEYADAGLWRAYASEYGIKELTLRFLEAIEPMVEDAEDKDVVRRFRERKQRSG